MSKTFSRLFKSNVSRSFMAMFPILLLVVLVVTAITPTFASPSTPQQTDQDNAAFVSYWKRVGGNVLWGPAITGPVLEPFKEGANGQRMVQYFDKGRMEQNTPGGSVSSGLLVLEMISGKVQVGENQVENLTCAISSPIAGDLNTLAPTYEDLGLVVDKGECKGMNISGCAEPNRVGKPVENEISVQGNTVYVQPVAELAAKNVLIGKYDAATSHNIPQVFVSYINKNNPAQFGLPISEPYWIKDVKVDGIPRQVMVQAFERRVLTYTGYDHGWQVQISNTGQHYVLCRYGQYMTPR